MILRPEPAATTALFAIICGHDDPPGIGRINALFFHDGFSAPKFQISPTDSVPFGV
jgi:hypothetical protein